MDFLKTLMLYMTLMTSLAVQEGPLPETVPTPTPLPPYVTATPAPFQTEAPTATPAPSLPPVELLPASSKYETLQYQMRGSDVRKLQRKLIALGYMPAGSDDGAYGYQTYNAVKDFQRANGLEADGVAGPATLTNLYDNPNILPKETPMPVVTATPTPTVPPLESFAVGTLPPPEQEDALVYENALALERIPDAIVINGDTGEIILVSETVDELTMLRNPGVWHTAEGQIVLSLQELVNGFKTWTLMGSSADGVYTLTAAGYQVQIQHIAGETLVLCDGEHVALAPTDVQLQDGVIYVTEDFLKTAIGASTIYDADESSLILFVRDKAMAESAD